jgi:hypothetical protein
MKTFIARRRGIAAGPNELDAALTRLREFEDRPSMPWRWLHSFALRESDGRFGLLCVFEAEAAQVLRAHARATSLPAEEVLPVTGAQIVRDFAPTLVHLVRRRRAWLGPDEARHASADAACIAIDKSLARRLSHLRSYTVREDAGGLGSYCLYQAADVPALLEHAERCGLPADEITPVIGRVVFRETDFFPNPAGSASSSHPNARLP